MDSVPEIDLTDPAVLADPLAAHRRAQAQGPVARVLTPGFGPFWLVTRHETARAMLADPRFAINAGSFMRPPGIPEHCLRYMRTMSEMEGPEHARLRRLVAPAFTPQRAAAFRPRIQRIVDALLDGLPATGAVDLLADVAGPLPMEVICELVGIPEADRAGWRTHGRAVAAVNGADFAAAIPAIMADAQAAVARRREEPGDDVLSDLIDIQEQDGDRLSEAELVTLVWHLVLAGQTPTNLIANGVAALLQHPDQLAALRADPALLPGAVEELLRWAGPQMMAVPRYARDDVDIDGVRIGRGEAVSAGIGVAGRDPRVFDDPDRLDVTRAPKPHLALGHGPHFCLGASLARIETEVAIATLLRRFPNLALVDAPQRAVDPATWRLSSLHVTLA